MALDNVETGRPVSSFEFAPAALFYLPVAVYWAWLAIRHRSLALPTLANPAIAAGGLCGESKADVLDLLGPAGRAWLAPFISIVMQGDDAVYAARRAAVALERAGISFPVVAKPDIGRRGNGVRPIDDEEQLARYLASFPPGHSVILQRLVPYEAEAGIFYVRHPSESRGRILSLTLKHTPRIVGDGRTTVKDLILRDPRAGRVPHLYFSRLGKHLARILPAGEVLPLVFTGNHCKGAIFEDGRAHISAALCERFNEICQEIPGFHFGRFDVRFRSLDELRRGEAFAIIEVNGAGSEATHIWDRRTRLMTAYRVLFEQIRIAFEIGGYYRRHGLKPMTGVTLLRRFLAERRLMKTYPAEELTVMRNG